MTDAEKLRLAVEEGIYVGDVRTLGPILVAEVERLTAKAEACRDEADRERLGRRDTERWLRAIKETLRPYWSDYGSNWDGSLCGLPGVVVSVAREFAKLGWHSSRMEEFVRATLRDHHKSHECIGDVACERCLEGRAILGALDEERSETR